MSGMCDLLSESCDLLPTALIYDRKPLAALSFDRATTEQQRDGAPRVLRLYEISVISFSAGLVMAMRRAPLPSAWLRCARGKHPRHRACCRTPVCPCAPS